MPGFVRHSTLLLLTIVFVGGGLLACGGGAETAESDVVTDAQLGPIPTPPSARRAVDQALQTFNDHCVAPSAQGEDASYPLELFNPSPSAPSLKYQQLRAFVEAGLLDTTVVQGQGNLPIHRFNLTRKGRAAQYEIAQSRTYTPMFCYAVPHVVRLDSIKAVYNSGPNPLASVWYAYSYRNLGDWRRSRSIRRGYTAIPPLPSASDTLQTNQLLVRVDGSWIDRRLTGYERPPDHPSPQ